MQVFHVCGIIPSQQFSFLCPNGTIFNQVLMLMMMLMLMLMLIGFDPQEYFICDWWFNVDCSQARTFSTIVVVVVVDIITAE